MSMNALLLLIIGVAVGMWVMPKIAPGMSRAI